MTFRPLYRWLPDDPWTEEEFSDEEERRREAIEEKRLEYEEGRTNDEPR